MDWTLEHEGRLVYSYEHFALAKTFVFRKWREHAAERQAEIPVDLSAACKYGSLFMNQVFGGSIQGHYQHQYNRIGGRIVDLSHDAADVGRMANPYLHEQEYFAIPELRRSLDICLPRVDIWVAEFMAGLPPAWAGEPPAICPLPNKPARLCPAPNITARRQTPASY